ncbi:hypothetical protein LB465_03005 [Salegentibacter sp. LM13S]|uniref:hypothetical protein n=1 Tax=Salegentibacter lacus TaxID=2873599 RepID=UPI001CCA441E|nr:hypothetical protein [Salegentibacter lacus]MBZ9629735.1 hypothetical protein [Salegentibacter lacus]
MKLIKFFLLILILVSCDKDESDSPLQISSKLIEMEGEGGQAEVSVTGNPWKISEIVNRDGNVTIKGDVYSDNEEHLIENKRLALEGLGQLNALWSNKGFKIIRNSPTSLKIIVEENSSGESFNFVIVLESQGELKEILVSQKKSQGYQFEKIEYFLKENDGDSIYKKRGVGYKFDIMASQEFSFNPINGVDVNRSSYYESSENDAFVWIKQDSVKVKFPVNIYEDEITYSEEKILYTNTVSNEEHRFQNLSETVTLPKGESELYTEVEYRKRKISYVLHLLNNRTNEPKTIEGIWIEYAPTGEYSIHWQN